MNHLDTYITAKAALTARFTPAQLRAHQRAAVTRITEAKHTLDVAGDLWVSHPYDPERLVAVQMASEELDNAVATAGEWDIPGCPRQTIRAGAH